MRGSGRSDLGGYVEVYLVLLLTCHGPITWVRGMRLSQSDTSAPSHGLRHFCPWHAAVAGVPSLLKLEQNLPQVITSLLKLEQRLSLTGALPRGQNRPSRSTITSVRVQTRGVAASQTTETHRIIHSLITQHHTTHAVHLLPSILRKRPPPSPGCQPRQVH